MLCNGGQVVKYCLKLETNRFDPWLQNTTLENNGGGSSGAAGSGSSAAPTGESSAPAAGDSAKTEAGGAGPDSLASPAASRSSWLAVRCVFCNQQLVHTDGEPKLLECLHSVCEPCFAIKLEERAAAAASGTERAVTCATCHLPSVPANMIEQRFVAETRSAEAGSGANGNALDATCSSCEDTEPATSYCVECADLICDNCVLAHQRLKITKDHTIKGKDEALAELQAGASGGADMLCKEHPQERLTLFCETCDRLTCRDCQLLHHRDHKYQFSGEMAAQARRAIAALLSEVSYKRVLLGSAMKVIRERQALIADKKKALVHEITQCVVKLTHAINTRGKQLVLRLGEVCDAKQRTLTEKKEALERLSAVTDHCVEFCSGALQHGSDTALLHAKRHLTRHLQRVKSRRADIPNPEIPVRIGLALDNLPDVVRLLATLGGVVVDGKVDGATPPAANPVVPVSASAPAPYHQPTAPALAPVSSAAAAMQQHAAAAAAAAAHHQGYVQAQSPVGGPGGPPPPYGSAVMSQLQQLARPLTHTPLRHPHVTSTTHPAGPGPHDMNLRGLLTPAAAAHARQQQLARHNHQLMQHAYHQVMGAYASGVYGAGTQQNRARVGPRTPSPAPVVPAVAPAPVSATHYTAPPAAKWHIPQHANVNAGTYDVPSSGGGHTDFKITLGRSPASTGNAAAGRHAAVTSTNPKTPSPSLTGTLSADPTVSLDKLCAESVQDLMATIAKLDSNGVQVLPETAPAASPHVHSSTDDHPGKPANATATTGADGAGDPNEDWCAVCMDGGELICCDKCPKVFHQYCHIPTIDKLPEETETWQCLLCVNFAELGEEDSNILVGAGGLTARQQKIMERITLELYCQYETSLPFREPASGTGAARPVCLDAVRARLQPIAPDRYTHPGQFVADLRLMFRNAISYNPPDSTMARDARRLEDFLDVQLAKWLPEYAEWRPPSTLDEPTPAAGPPSAKRPRLHAEIL
ncbi:E3 ubiquitin-protein ligase TRIM33 [Eumeta japonica]|uniref:E3 ubiquitin-protein ligase TRIM33 n=1 Tax=Eumeta variegata TaxID=151549 RepID=A0A4C1Z757_EUMVA|nr:E3 ubiquitin-protein ligase TRIM33 [Eumeta japonica]